MDRRYQYGYYSAHGHGATSLHSVIRNDAMPCLRKIAWIMDIVVEVNCCAAMLAALCFNGCPLLGTGTDLVSVAEYYIDNVLKNINLADELAANINDIDAYNQYLDAIDNVAKNANIYAIVAYVANNANAANAVIAVIIIVIHLITDSITSITRIINDTKSSNFYWHISNILNTYTNIAQYAIKQYLIKYPANAADAADAADANAANVDGANGVNIRRLNFYDKIALPNEYSIKQYDDDAINSAVRNAAITAIIANRTDYILSTHYARKESVVGADNVEPLTKTYVEATTEISGKDESNKRNYFIKQFIKNCKLQDTTLLTEIATTLETQSKKYIPRISLKEGDFSGTSLTIFTNYQKRLYNIDNIKISFKEKKKLSQAQLKSLRGEFMNELLYNALRSQTATNNKKIREYIIGRALYATPILSPNLGLEPEEALDYKNDPLGIAVPWEEKYGKKQKSKS